MTFFSYSVATPLCILVLGVMHSFMLPIFIVLFMHILTWCFIHSLLLYIHTLRSNTAGIISHVCRHVMRASRLRRNISAKLGIQHAEYHCQMEFPGYLFPARPCHT